MYKVSMQPSYQLSCIADITINKFLEIARSKDFTFAKTKFIAEH